MRRAPTLLLAIASGIACRPSAGSTSPGSTEAGSERDGWHDPRTTARVRVDEMSMEWTGDTPSRVTVFGVSVDAQGLAAVQLCDRLATALVAVLRRPSVSVTFTKPGRADDTAACDREGPPPPTTPSAAVDRLVELLEERPALDAALAERAVTLILRHESALQAFTASHPVVVRSDRGIDDVLESLDRTPADEHDIEALRIELAEVTKDLRRAYVKLSVDERGAIHIRGRELAAKRIALAALIEALPETRGDEALRTVAAFEASARVVAQMARYSGVEDVQIPAFGEVVAAEACAAVLARFDERLGWWRGRLSVSSGVDRAEADRMVDSLARARGETRRACAQSKPGGAAPR